MGDENPLNFVRILTDTVNSMAQGFLLPQSLWFRRILAAGIDFGVELLCGVMGSYFGAMVAALTMILHEVSPQATQRFIWTGMVSGFVFWYLSASWINRVLIQGISRASFGKRLMEIEIISLGAPISWSVMMRHWITAAMVGEIRVVSSRDRQNLAPIYELKKPADRVSQDKKAA